MPPIPPPPVQNVPSILPGSQDPDYYYSHNVNMAALEQDALDKVTEWLASPDAVNHPDISRLAPPQDVIRLGIAVTQGIKQAAPEIKQAMGDRPHTVQEFMDLARPLMAQGIREAYTQGGKQSGIPNDTLTQLSELFADKAISAAIKQRTHHGRVDGPDGRAPFMP